MQTTITYNIPESQIDSILSLLGYESGDKAMFLNEAIKNVVIPAISDVFVGVKQKEIAEVQQKMPGEVRQMVESMISITTL